MSNAGDNNDPEITINADGTFTPTGGVTINPGGVVKFKFAFNSGPDTVCTIPFGTITVTNPPKIAANPSGTIKVGS